MELGTAIVGAVLGGVVAVATKKKHKVLKYALLGGGVGVGVTFLGKTFERPAFKVGQGHQIAPPFSLPDPALPGQMDYTVDPRRDPRLDPVSREHLYPAWLLMHWQAGDRNIIAQAQHMLGIPADGSLGGATTTAIQHVQARAGLPVTGVMDYATMQALVAG